MKIPYDFLFTNKIPFLYFYKSKIIMKDGFLTALNGKDGIKIIPVASVAILILGFGTSITQEAILFCSKHNCLICFSRGGFNCHVIFMEGRYRNPVSIINHVNLFQNKKLEIAKELLKLRLIINKEREYIHKIEECKTINEILGLEGIYYRKKYKTFSEKYNVENFKRNFDFELKNKEDYSRLELVNGRLNILNNVLYSFMSAIIYTTSLEPSLGFIHGRTRRGGLAFDLADILKVEIILPLCFDLKYEQKDLMILLRNKLSENNFYYIKLMLKICDEISKGNVFKAEELYDSCNFKQV